MLDVASTASHVPLFVVVSHLRFWCGSWEDPGLFYLLRVSHAAAKCMRTYISRRNSFRAYDIFSVQHMYSRTFDVDQCRAEINLSVVKCFQVQQCFGTQMSGNAEVYSYVVEATSSIISYLAHVCILLHARSWTTRTQSLTVHRNQMYI